MQTSFEVGRELACWYLSRNRSSLGLLLLSGRTGAGELPLASFLHEGCCDPARIAHRLRTPGAFVKVPAWNPGQRLPFQPLNRMLP